MESRCSELKSEAEVDEDDSVTPEMDVVGGGGVAVGGEGGRAGRGGRAPRPPSGERLDVLRGERLLRLLPANAGATGNCVRAVPGDTSAADIIFERENKRKVVRLRVFPVSFAPTCLQKGNLPATGVCLQTKSRFTPGCRVWCDWCQNGEVGTPKATAKFAPEGKWGAPPSLPVWWPATTN